MLRQESSTRISKRAVLIGVVLIIANKLLDCLHRDVVAYRAPDDRYAVSQRYVRPPRDYGVEHPCPSDCPKCCTQPARPAGHLRDGWLWGVQFSGHDCMPRLMGLIPYAFRFATPENDWEALLFRHLPPWLVVSDLRAVTDFFEGEVDFFRDGYYRYWITPILAWSVVIFSLMLIFLCLTSLIRRQWVAHEKLAYPVIQNSAGNHGGQRGNLQKPSALDGVWNCRGDQSAQRASVFLSRLALNSCQAIRPQYLLLRRSRGMRWGSMPLRLHPYMIGLGFILPLDLSFSCAFFYLFGKMQLLYGSMMGIMHLPGYPFFGEQGTGALFALLLITCWSGRRHFSLVISRVFRPDREDEATEPLSYRATVIILFLCLLVLMGFCIKGGMSIWGLCDFHLHLSADYCWIDTHASGVGSSHSGGRLCHAPIPDNLDVWYAPSPRGESDDAFHVELVERRELRIVSDTSDARSDGSVQTR